MCIFFLSSRRRNTRLQVEWSSDVCSSDLAQDFYWYNPSRLPTPAEWVTIRRTRVKEAVTHIWWLSKTTEPRSEERRVGKEGGSQWRMYNYKEECNRQSLMCTL